MSEVILKLFKLLFLLIIVSLAFQSCKHKSEVIEMEEELIEEDTIELITVYDCNFVQNDNTSDGIIDPVERYILDGCFENRFTSKIDIEANLIGEWALVGHGEGWFLNISEPCGYMTITADQIIFEFENGYIDTTTTHSWEIVEASASNFHLFVSPNAVGLAASIFCNNFMYTDVTPVDGNMYLYQKMN